ncbi:hypothetical protein NB311A_09401 [Nitrobacter sp. Nb-311A]|uniref:hypothetical protein n=1 Tax=unclassified Nitrobacter TaxID=2620411 RepID=UPI0000684AA4|nr:MULTISPECIES: hypothetical protein [unclassified Nitrobacter]EAQ34129.1 hypothetical protein NB311A_09401 [Nitrobacter sp. Nb-311A]MCV0387583.1 hypothetical protein [Nitrobacter sp.]
MPRKQHPANPLRISRRDGTLLLRLLEQQQPVITHDLLMGLAGGDLISGGALKAESVSTSVMVMDDDGPRAVDLEWISDHRAYGYFSPDGYILPDPKDLQSYKLDVAWWLKWLASELALVDTGMPYELVKGEAWDLGNFWVTRQSKVPILFARRLKHQSIAKKLMEALTNRAGRSGGLILTSSKRSPELAEWPHRFRVMSLADLLSHDPKWFRLDRDIIDGMFSPMSGGRSAERVSLSSDFRTLVIDGQMWIFRGEIQKNIIHLLVEAFRKGERLRTSDVLRKAGSQSPDFAKAFKNNPSWPRLNRYIKTDHGFCWIELRD